MLSVYNIITEINSSFKFKGKWQGVAELITRDGITIPTINEKHCGVDDKEPLVAYHRLGNITSSTPRANPGYGRDNDVTNTYTNSMVLFINQRMLKLFPDEVFLTLQASIPHSIHLPPYKSVLINIRDVVMSSQTVWQQEYTNAAQYRLKSDQYLIKINYQIEATFKKGCFANC